MKTQYSNSELKSLFPFLIDSFYLSADLLSSIANDGSNIIRVKYKLTKDEATQRMDFSSKFLQSELNKIINENSTA